MGGYSKGGGQETASCRLSIGLLQSPQFLCSLLMCALPLSVVLLGLRNVVFPVSSSMRGVSCLLFVCCMTAGLTKTYRQTTDEYSNSSSR